MPELQPIGRDIYMRHTDKDGRLSIQHHRVWDRDRFITACQNRAAKEGGKAKSEVITQEQYKAN